MDAKEALALFEQAAKGEITFLHGALPMAHEALREKVAREEARSKRPSLEKQEKAIRRELESNIEAWGDEYGADERTMLIATADTIRVVRERIVPWLRAHASSAYMDPLVTFSRQELYDHLIALGEDPHHAS